MKKIFITLLILFGLSSIIYLYYNNLKYKTELSSLKNQNNIYLKQTDSIKKLNDSIYINYKEKIIFYNKINDSLLKKIDNRNKKIKILEIELNKWYEKVKQNPNIVDSTINSIL